MTKTKERKPIAKADRSAETLTAILDAIDAIDTAKVVLADAQGGQRADLKTYNEEVDVAVAQARGSEDDDPTTKLVKIIDRWDALLKARADWGEKVKAARDEVKARETALAELRAAARQPGLFD